MIQNRNRLIHPCLITTQSLWHCHVPRVVKHTTLMHLEFYFIFSGEVVVVIFDVIHPTIAQSVYFWGPRCDCAGPESGFCVWRQVKQCQFSEFCKLFKWHIFQGDRFMSFVHVHWVCWIPVYIADYISISPFFPKDLRAVCNTTS